MPATVAPLPSVAERVTGAATLGRLILSASERGEKVAIRHSVDGVYRAISYRDLGESARSIARGMIELGLRQGDRVAILCSTRSEWTLVEAGAACAGLVVVPVYHTNSPEECRHVLAHSSARAVVCEDARQVEKIELVKDSCPELRHVVVIDGEAPGAIALDELCRRGEATDPAEVLRRVDAVEPADLATIVYTSGTTGPPKGCLLTHSNVLSASAMYRSQLQLEEVQPVIYMFLPLAHVLARIAQIVVIDVGGTLVYWRRDTGRIMEEIAETQPTHFVAVPRIYEKMRAGVLGAVEARGPHAGLLFAWALEVGRRARTLERSGRPLGRLGTLRLALARRAGLAQVAALFGARLKMALVGAAPIDSDVLEFFDACGVQVLEGYGMTESCAAATLNPPDAPRFGTVGRALPGSEVAISPEGEVLLRGEHVSAGYHQDPQATAETFAGGWLRTGDLGSISPDGYLTLTGRKKDLIVTSSGKNVSPANIENALREIRWVADAVAYGDRRPYLVCMLTLEPDAVVELADRFGIPAELAYVANDERVHQLLAEEVDRANRRFARPEQVKRFRVLDRDLTQATGELTPTLKVKRALVYRRYASFFDELYSEDR
jgi:long-chain acyl-CoA synthetase